MLMGGSLPVRFVEVWLVDFEFVVRPGEPPVPFCMVAREMSTGRTLRLWEEELNECKAAPFSTGEDALFVAYYASAEMGCFRALGWQLPMNVLDLYTEFRVTTNGLTTPCGNGLLGALAYYGLPGVEAVEKAAMRDLALRGGPWTPDEQVALFDYCESDVTALQRLLPIMAPNLDWPRALLRGRYMKAVAAMEHVGVPIDSVALETLRGNWEDIKIQLVEEIDADYGIFDGISFKADRFAAWLAQEGIPWPRLPSGALALDDDTFGEMARAYAHVAPIRELRSSLSKMRLSDLAVGTDGRDRCLLSPFSARTGRNQPSTTKFIFGPATWLRGLIKPAEGFGLAYIDWCQQEFGIAAALSGDPAMLMAYTSGDPYLAFAKQAGAVPPDGTKQTHGPVRDQFKACVLAVQYGMGAESLGARIGQPVARARELLELHRRAYPRYWLWSDGVEHFAMLRLYLYTVFGWTIHIGADANPRSLRNFPMQGNGAEMLRLACCLATERGIRVCAPVHDALLVEAPLTELDAVVAATQQAMSDASAVVLDGFRLRSDVKIVRYPDRYMDPRGERMWNAVWKILGGPPSPGEER